MLQLGRTLRDVGRLREAEQVLTSSLVPTEPVGRDGRAASPWTEFNLAIVLDRLGEHEAARRLWERVLETSDREIGPDSELSVQTATNLAITLRKLRRYGDEFPLRVRAGVDPSNRPARRAPRNVPGRGRPGPDPSPPRQPRNWR